MMKLSTILIGFFVTWVIGVFGIAPYSKDIVEWIGTPLATVGTFLCVLLPMGIWAVFCVIIDTIEDIKKHKYRR